jgi:hypothetical protein
MPQIREVGQYHWYEKFAFLPKKCSITGKRIWLRKGMKGVRMITGPGTPVFLYKWIDSKQFLLERLKGNI